MAMDASRVWKNFLSGKQSVPTVACPSCGAEVPEFRIHSHLDSCLTPYPPPKESEPAAPPAPVGEQAANELSNSVQNKHRKGRGKGRKRKDGAQINKKERDRKKRALEDNVEGENQLGTPALSEGDDGDDDANLYQNWEFSVSGFEEFAKSREEEGILTDLQKRELFASGVLTIERRDVSTMVLELDRLLADAQSAVVVSSGILPRFCRGSRFGSQAVHAIGVAEQAW